MGFPVRDRLGRWIFGLVGAPLLVVLVGVGGGTNDRPLQRASDRIWSAWGSRRDHGPGRSGHVPGPGRERGSGDAGDRFGTFPSTRAVSDPGRGNPRCRG